MKKKIEIKIFEEWIKKNTIVKNLFASFLFGALNATSMAPIGLVIILPICISAFIIICRNAQNKKQAFLNAWSFGAGYFIFSLYWITYALFIDISTWWWVIPLSLIIAPAILGLYYGFIPLLAYRYKKHNDLYILSICASFGLIEFLRGNLFTGFPWNLFGYGWQHFLPLMQINAYVGIYGLTLLTIIWSAFFIIKNPVLKKAILLSFIISIALGTYRIALTKVEHYEDVGVRIVQPNIEQKIKWNPDKRYKNLEKLLDITISETENNMPIKFVIWPESATLYNLNQSSKAINITSAALPKDAIGIFGSINIEEKEDEEFIFNSVSFISREEKFIKSYNKHHLVPFGEYIPFRNIINLTPIANAISMIGDFSHGDGVKTIYLGNGLPSPSPLICYEAIFPTNVADETERPDWLVNVTNDGWYGNSAGPYQHFEITRVRAIEEGLPLVRSANTGISAIINPLGVVESKIALETEGKLDILLPKPLAKTLFSKYGNMPFFASLMLIFMLCEIAYKAKLKTE